MKNLLKTIWMVLIALSSNAQTYKDTQAHIECQLIDQETKDPLSYARVVLQKNGINLDLQMTNDSGKVVFQNLDTGTYLIICQYLAYDTLILKELIIEDKSQSLNLGILGMQATAILMDELQITGRKKLVHLRSDKEIIQMDQTLNTSNATAYEALRLSNSVQLNQDGEILLRGSKDFEVWIDGHPSPFKPSEALQQISASRIERIEIVTTPSLSKSSAGSGGYIEIITKKSLMDGWGFQTGVHAGTRGKYQVHLNTSYQKNKWEWNGSFIWKDHAQYYNMFGIMNTLSDSNLTKVVNTEFKRNQRDRNVSLNSNLEYTYNNNIKLNYAFDIGQNLRDISGLFKYDATKGGDLSHDYTLEDLGFNNYAPYITNQFSLIYTLSSKLDWRTDLTHSYIDYRWRMDQSRTFTDLSFSTQNRSPYFVLKVDNDNYSKDYRINSVMHYRWDDAHQLELGLNYLNYQRRIDLAANNLMTESQIWTPNFEFSNSQNFSEPIYSAWLQQTGTYKTLPYSMGVRIEYTDRLFESFTLNKNYKYKKLNWFPLVNLSKNFGDADQLTFYYSKRIDRPDEYFLNPFPDISNNYQKAFGNPGLRPHITNHLELKYSKILSNSKIQSSAYWKGIKNAYDQVISPDSTGKIILTFDNFTDQNAIGVENVFQYDPVKHYSIQTGLNLYYRKVLGRYQVYSLDKKQFNMEFKLMQNISFGRGTSFQCLFYYINAQYNSLGEIKPFYWVEATVNQTLWNGRFRISMHIRDIFNTNHTRYNINESDYTFSILRIPEYPVVMLSASYQIYQYKSKEEIAKTRLKLD